MELHHVTNTSEYETSKATSSLAFPTQQRLVPTACEQEGDLVVLLGATGGRGVEQPRAWTA